MAELNNVTCEEDSASPREYYWCRALRGCVSYIISLTTPRDACRLSVVADSDSDWENFLRSDYKHIISNSVSDSSFNTSLSKKDLYFHLCRNRIIVNSGSISFVLEKESRKKCFTVRARDY
ncbi:hypothetical protein CISIN_1g037817mg [Citrus sinensis]|uniref:Uncharacterized protein n=1 Tax=Citrus sinensis TaxID=2711 RepID=A0A067DK09_CITSI|nr:hypothetical protein CISIN_1g037817mg [Citrus sinensis]